MILIADADAFATATTRRRQSSIKYVTAIGDERPAEADGVPAGTLRGALAQLAAAATGSTRSRSAANSVGSCAQNIATSA